MKLLSIRSAKSIWLVPRDFLNPRGKFLRPAIPAFVERYSFAKYSEPKDAQDNQGTKFEFGSFTPNGGTPILLSMTVHTDGIVVETRSSTDDGDLFLDDALSWVSKEYGLPKVSDLPIRKIYASEVIVQAENTLHFLNERFSPFLKELSSVIGTD